MDQRALVGLDRRPEQAERGVAQRTVEQREQMFRRKRLELKNLRARDEGAVNVEERIMRRRADEPDGAVLDIRQQNILLGFVEAVNLVDEEDRLWPAVF